jgi:hypothetical protein
MRRACVLVLAAGAGLGVERLGSWLAAQLRDGHDVQDPVDAAVAAGGCHQGRGSDPQPMRGAPKPPARVISVHRLCLADRVAQPSPRVGQRTQLKAADRRIDRADRGRAAEHLPRQRASRRSEDARAGTPRPARRCAPPSWARAPRRSRDRAPSQLPAPRTALGQVVEAAVQTARARPARESCPSMPGPASRLLERLFRELARRLAALLTRDRRGGGSRNREGAARFRVGFAG